MDAFDFKVKWNGEKSSMEVRQKGEKFKGFLDGSHVLTVALEDKEVCELFCHSDLVYNSDGLACKINEALGSEDEEDDEDDDEDDDEEEDDEDEEEDDEEEDSDDDEDEIEEDADADYGEKITATQCPGVPTLHAVMVVYGKGIDVDGDVKIMRNFFNTLQQHKLANVQETFLKGAEATPDATLKVLNGLKPRSDDVVWFFYSGHGCMEEGDRLLCTRGKMLRRGAVVDALRRTPARFKVVLSDCCAVESGRLEPEEKAGAGRPRFSAERLGKLLTSYRGFFDVSSSSDYQYSFGGVFTPTLIDKVLLQATPETWTAVFEETQRQVMAESDGALPDEAKKALLQEGRQVEDHQKPVAFMLPQQVE